MKLLRLGVAVTTVGEFLRQTMVGPWIAWLSSGTILAGVGMLVGGLYVDPLVPSDYLN